MVTEIIEDVLNNGCLIICIIDDYTSVHRKRRPTEEQACKAIHIAQLSFAYLKTFLPYLLEILKMFTIHLELIPSQYLIMSLQMI